MLMDKFGFLFVWLMIPHRLPLISLMVAMIHSGKYGFQISSNVVAIIGDVKLVIIIINTYYMGTIVNK